MGVRTRCAASAINSSDCFNDLSSRDIRLFSDETSGTISEGTGFATGLRSCGPLLATESARRLSGPMVVDAAHTDNNAASAKKPMPNTAALRDI